MARTPSMTPQEAEALLGPRGALFVTAANKPLVRKWCTSMGLPGAYAAALAFPQLAGCYNGSKHDGRNDRLDWHKEQAINKGQTGAADDDDMDTDSAATQSIASAVSSNGNGHDIVTANSTMPSTQDAQIQRIASLLGELLTKPGVDAAAVNAIIERKWSELPDLIARYSPVMRIEIKTESGEFRPIDGHAHKMLPMIIQTVAQNVPVMLVGPAGGGKSTCGEQVAHALDLPFYLQGAASGTHEYLGYKDGYGNYHSTPFRQAFEHGGLFCAEELDSGSADIPLILNAGLANGHMAFPDCTMPIKRHADFRIIANANTYCTGADRVYVGRTQLDGATIDRFAFFNWDYDSSLERKLCGNDAWCDRVQALRRGAEMEKARLIISPRASINGAKMIAAGWTFEQCESAFIWKGTDKELQRRIEAAAR